MVGSNGDVLRPGLLADRVPETDRVTPVVPAAGARNSYGSAAIAAELRRAILDGDYAFDDRLPAERHLARLFNASRSTVRAALRRLEENHLVVRRIGSGTFVSYRPATREEEIAEITSPLELTEVRLAVEPHMTRLAVGNATARDIDHLGAALERVEASGTDPEYFTHWDGEFHQRLAQCSHNPLLVWIYGQINDVRSHALWNVMKDKVLTPEAIAEYNRQHRGIYESLRIRDVDEALRIIHQHLEKARRDLLGASSY